MTSIIEHMSMLYVCTYRYGYDSMDGKIMLALPLSYNCSSVAEHWHSKPKALGLILASPPFF